MFAGICRGLEVEVVTREPVGAECKGSCGSCGGIHGTGEGGNTVAPQGHALPESSPYAESSHDE